MIEIEDYQGKAFGSFQIIEHIASGAEAEVYFCADLRNYMPLILRLDSHHDDTWTEPQILPPNNSSIERANVRGSWHASDSYRTKVKVDKNTFSFRVATVYGVYQIRYLVPLSLRFRIRHAMDILDVLKVAPADDILYFGFWESIALEALTAADRVCAGRAQENEFREKWGILLGGPIMRSAIALYMNSGSLSPSRKQAVINLLASIKNTDVQFAENLILRLIGALERGRISYEQALATIRCRHFRRNISHTELQQLVTAYQLLDSTNTIYVGDNPKKLLVSLLLAIATEPADEWEELDVEETPEPEPEKFDLFLQEHAGMKAIYPQLEMEKR